MHLSSLRLLLACTCFVFMPAIKSDALARHPMEQNSSEPTGGLGRITVYTHGDSRFAQLQRNGDITGSAPEALACAMPKLGVPYQFSVLPLSRARVVVESFENALWFPSGHAGDEDRMSRLIGPIDDVTILWYQLKSNAADPNSEEFRENARVTAYTGSALERELRQNNYNVTHGSADHNRLIYMIMSGDIDALLAIDFRDVLTEDTRKLVDERIRVTLRRKVPISFEASVALKKNHPSFINRLREAMTGCHSRP